MPKCQLQGKRSSLFIRSVNDEIMSYIFVTRTERAKSIEAFTNCQTNLIKSKQFNKYHQIVIYG